MDVCYFAAQNNRSLSRKGFLFGCAVRNQITSIRYGPRGPYQLITPGILLRKIPGPWAWGMLFRCAERI